MHRSRGQHVLHLLTPALLMLGALLNGLGQSAFPFTRTSRCLLLGSETGSTDTRSWIQYLRHNEESLLAPYCLPKIHLTGLRTALTEKLTLTDRLLFATQKDGTSPSLPHNSTFSKE